MWDGLIRLADQLFGAAMPPDRSGRRGLARYLAVAAVLALVIFARRPDSILRPQFWGEDGRAFFYEQLTIGFWRALLHLHYGLPYLAARIVAALGSVVPTAAVPLVYNASAIAITALAMATFSLPGFRHLVRSDGLRVAVCVAAVCIPAGQDLLTSPSTLHYFLGIWLIFLSVVRAPQPAASVVAWCVGGALAVLSSAAAPLAAPLWFLRAIRGVSRREPRDLAFAATQIAVLFLVGAVARMDAEATELTGHVSAFDVQTGDLQGALGALGWTVALSVDAAALPAPAVHWLEAHGTLPVIAPTAIVAVFVALAFRNLSSRGRVTVSVAIYLFVASLYLILTGRPIIVRIITEGTVQGLRIPVLTALGTRHRALPNIAFLLLAAGIIDGAERVRTRVVAAGACVGLLFVWALGFRIQPFPDLHWPVWAARLDAKLASGSTERLVIPSHPAPFFNIIVDASPPPTPAALEIHDEPPGG